MTNQTRALIIATCLAVGAGVATYVVTDEGMFEAVGLSDGGFEVVDGGTYNGMIWCPSAGVMVPLGSECP